MADNQMLTVGVAFVLLVTLIAIGASIASNFRQTTVGGETIAQQNYTVSFNYCNSTMVDLRTVVDYHMTSITNSSVAFWNASTEDDTITYAGNFYVGENLSACVVGVNDLGEGSYNISMNYNREKPNLMRNTTIAGEQGFNALGNQSRSLGTVIGAAIVVTLLFGIFWMFRRGN